MDITVSNMIIEYLNNNKYEGLCCPEKDCGCGLDDLAPCEENIMKCYPAYKCECHECKCLGTNECSFDVYELSVHYYAPSKCKDYKSKKDSD